MSFQVAIGSLGGTVFFQVRLGTLLRIMMSISNNAWTTKFWGSLRRYRNGFSLILQKDHS